jgi:hypothetical protein
MICLPKRENRELTTDTEDYQMIMRLGVFCTLARLLVPFLACPTSAASPATTVDVARIDAFVRQQVERHGIPGLALALVDGDQIVHLGGYGKADQTGRMVRRPRLYARLEHGRLSLGGESANYHSAPAQPQLRHLQQRAGAGGLDSPCPQFDLIDHLFYTRACQPNLPRIAYLRTAGGVVWLL